MNLFGTLRKKREESRDDALARYYAYLGSVNVDDVTDANAAELHDLLGAVGFTLERFEADHAKVTAAKENIGLVAEIPDAKSRVEKLHDVLMEAYAERQRQFARCNEAITKASNEHVHADAELQRRYAARRSLEHLQEADPLIYKAVADTTSGKKRKG